MWEPVVSERAANLKEEKARRHNPEGGGGRTRGQPSGQAVCAGKSGNATNGVEDAIAKKGSRRKVGLPLKKRACNLLLNEWGKNISGRNLSGTGAPPRFGKD